MSRAIIGQSVGVAVHPDLKRFGVRAKKERHVVDVRFHGAPAPVQVAPGLDQASPGQVSVVEALRFLFEVLLVLSVDLADLRPVGQVVLLVRIGIRFVLLVGIGLRFVVLVRAVLLLILFVLLPVRTGLVIALLVLPRILRFRDAGHLRLQIRKVRIAGGRR